MHLYEISDQYRGALALLDDPELPIEALQDTLEALEGEFEGKGKAVIATALNFKAQAAMVDETVKKLQARSKALKAKDASLRDYLLTNMEACGISKIESPHFAATVKQGGSKSVVVDDLDALPADYTKQTITADKALIKKAIGDGYEVAGARIEVKNTLMIK